jgi:hypothetical protein
VSALTAGGIAAHFIISHVPIAFGLILLSMGLKPIFAPNFRMRQWAALLLTPFAVAVVSMLTVTLVDSRGIERASSGSLERQRCGCHWKFSP